MKPDMAKAMEQARSEVAGADAGYPQDEYTNLARALDKSGVIVPPMPVYEQLVIKAIAAMYDHVERSGWPYREQVEPGSAHLTVSGRFQSDKYPWCPAGFVPIKTTDPMAQDLLREYAKRRAAVDKDFCADLLAALPPEGEQAIPPKLKEAASE